MKKENQKSGFSLLWVLMMIALFSGLIMVYFDRVRYHAMIIESYPYVIETDSILQSAIGTVESDLIAEIAAGSSSDSKWTVNSVPLYSPVNRWNMLPSPSGVPEGKTLVKRSAHGVPFFKEQSGKWRFEGKEIYRASAVSTNEPNLQGRKIYRSLWALPQLTEEGEIQEPDWVLLTGKGPKAFDGYTASVSDPQSPDHVLGRYAYQIYDQGGLLNANALGLIGSINPEDQGRKGSQAYGDFEAIPGLAAFGKSVFSWRKVSASGTLREWIKGMAATGWNSPYQGGMNWIQTRGQLLDLAKEQGVGSQVMRSLTTFQRHLNAPSFTPDPGRNKIIGTGYQGGNDFFGKDDEYNPSLINTRVKQEFVRGDGTTAKVGEPLIKHRFPLSRLGLILRDATAANGSDIYKYFGLTRNAANAPWVYNHGSATKIYTLDEVAAQGREPDFFELLQAGINVGSLGKSLSVPYTRRTSVNNPSDQVMEIGASLVDQYDSDGFPSAIQFNGGTFTGTEQLPYLTRMIFMGVPTDDDTYGFYYLPELWNPYDSTQKKPSDSPTQFRVYGDGDFSFVGLYYTTAPAQSMELSLSTASLPFSSQDNSFSDPWVKTRTDLPYDGIKLVEIPGMIAKVTPPDPSWLKKAQTAYQYYVLAEQNSFYLQYLDKGKWITYGQMTGASLNKIGGSYYFYTTYYGGGQLKGMYNSFFHVDPRSDRFEPFLCESSTNTTGELSSYDFTIPQWVGPTGVGLGDGGMGRVWPLGQTIRPTATDRGSAGYMIYPFNPLAYALNSGWYYSANDWAQVYVGHLSRNTAKRMYTEKYCYYADSDGVIRGADGAYEVENNPAGQPLVTGNHESRPVVLNRPFHSVGEMGYAFRGESWKSLNFFTSESGDPALLDLFCLNEDPVSAVTGDRVNLNSAPESVLKVLLGSATKKQSAFFSKNDLLTENQVKFLAANFRKGIEKNGPLVNPSDLVTSFVGKTDGETGIPIGGGYGMEDAIIKQRREASIRALADVADFRTWNVMIDLVVQAGRYPKTAKQLKDFQMKAERHYWVHLAIDRYTGKVIDRQVENVD